MIAEEYVLLEDNLYADWTVEELAEFLFVLVKECWFDD